MNKSEMIVYNQLLEEGYKQENISFDGSKSPDFILSDNKGIEVKRMINNIIQFTPKQIETLKGDCEVWIIKNNKIIGKEFFKNIKNSGLLKNCKNSYIYSYKPSLLNSKRLKDDT